MKNINYIAFFSASSSMENEDEVFENYEGFFRIKSPDLKSAKILAKNKLDEYFEDDVFMMYSLDKVVEYKSIKKHGLKDLYELEDMEENISIYEDESQDKISSIKESYHYCPNCKEQKVKQELIELENEVQLKIYRCTNCEYQSNQEELWEYQLKNQDKL